MKKLILLLITLCGFLGNAQNEDLVKKANENLERGNRKGAIDMASKALEKNPQDHEARWIRARSLLTNNSTEDQFNKAISDFNFMIDNGVNTSKVFNALGLAEEELARYIYHYKKAKENTSYTDDNSAFIKEQTEYYNESINHYNLALEAYKKAAQVNPEEKTSINYKIKNVERSITDVQDKIKNLK